ncbi:MAG: RluA family pseudouridine synthase [Opitutales bacterium]
MATPRKPAKRRPARIGSQPQARTAKALKRKARPAKAPVEEARPDEIFRTRIPGEFEPARADKIIATLLDGVSRSRVQKALDLGMVKVNGLPANCRTVLNPGDAVEVALPSPGEPTARPVKMALEILFEDAHLIAVNKPAGLLTHPVQGSDEVSVIHGLLHHTKGKLAPAGGAPRPGVVHRLDRETSGVIVLAKTDKAYHALVAQFAERTAQKEYLALVDKAPRLLSGVINANIDRHRTVRVRMAVREDGREAVTDWRVEEKYGEQAALVRTFPHTGRTHQIRVHLAHIAHPILGDRTYGKFDVPAFDGWPMPRVMLHARRLTLSHPQTGRPLVIEVAPPKDFVALQRWLGIRFGRRVFAV